MRNRAPDIDEELLNELESALRKVRSVLTKIESADGRKIDYKAWSEAKGSYFGKLIEAETLDSKYLENCQLVPSRYALLSLMKKGGCVAEIGTQFGQFASHISRITKPKELHLFDLEFGKFQENWGGLENIHIHQGDSSTLVEKMDRSFDWVYLDGDHSYDGVTKDLYALKEKIVPGGILICNDYTVWSPLEACRYGIPKAVHEFCVDQKWGFRYMALHPWGYHDVALQRLEDIKACR